MTNYEAYKNKPLTEIMKLFRKSGSETIEKFLYDSHEWNPTYKIGDIVYVENTDMLVIVGIDSYAECYVVVRSDDFPHLVYDHVEGPGCISNHSLDYAEFTYDQLITKKIGKIEDKSFLKCLTEGFRSVKYTFQAGS